MTWQWDYYANRWEYQSDVGVWRINYAKDNRVYSYGRNWLYNLSLEGEYIRSGSLEQLKDYVTNRRYGPLIDSAAD